MKSKVKQRPLTPFFLFLAEQKKRHSDITSKEAGRKWQNLTEEKKSRYVSEYEEARKKFEKYVEGELGFSLQTQRVREGRPTSIPTSRIRAVLGRDPKILPMEKELYSGVEKVIEAFLKDFGSATVDQLVKGEKRIVKVETVVNLSLIHI
eukprot:TRINITY_DN23445_c0_g1_i1.p1 TRINITY_DN23445_c0_g1~~TRINITY_DN23445_c0_g1_i1.p1  ORF type:complete len:150 (-),score=23.91 TRINITY_DN23445_c0_g1_i1:119-568(-)